MATKKKRVLAKSSKKNANLKSVQKERRYITRTLGTMTINLTPDNKIHTFIEGVGGLIGGAERLLKKIGAEWKIEGDEVSFAEKDRKEIEQVFKHPLMLTPFNESVKL